MVRIDCHTHVGFKAFLARPIAAEKRSRPAFQDGMENSITNLLSRMDANEVTRAVTFPFPLEEIDRQAANDYVMQGALRYPERIIPFALVGDDTTYWLKQGARGFKQQNILYAPERFNLTRAYDIMAEAGVPLLIHFRAGPGYDVTEQVLAILSQTPTLTIIVAHMGRHTPNTSHRVEAALLGLREHPNVFFETSTVRDPGMIDRAVSIVGADRVLFGSDFPFNAYLDDDPLSVEIGVIESAELPLDAKAKVLGENIMNVLGIARQTNDRH